MRYTFAILCLLLTGCLPGNFGMKSIPPKHPQYESRLTLPQRDALMYAYNQRLDERFTGPVLGRVSLVTPPAARTIYARFTPPPEYDGFNLYGGTNLNRSDWRLLVTTTNTVIPIQVALPYEFFGLKAFLRNGPDGTETESTWATTP